MLSKIKLFLGALSIAGVVGKLGFLGGPIGAIAGAVATFFVQIVKWFFEGVTVIVSNPVTLVTVALAAALSFGSGVKLGKDWTYHLVEKRDAVIKQMLTDSKRADDANKLKLKSALDEKAKAEQAQRDKLTAEAGVKPVSPVAEPRRVRPAKPRTSCKDSGGGSGLFAPGSIWGSALPCKST